MNNLQRMVTKLSLNQIASISGYKPVADVGLQTMSVELSPVSRNKIFFFVFRIF